MDLPTLLLVSIVFCLVNTVTLRVSCCLANFLGKWSPDWPQLRIPSYRSSFVIVLGGLIMFGLFAGVSESVVENWAPSLLSKRTSMAILGMAEMYVLVILLAWGISDEQPSSTRLTTIAAVLHLLLVAALVTFMGQLRLVY